MKAQASKARGAHAARKSTQTAPLTRMIVLDALRSWVIPTVAMTTGFVIFVLYNVDVVDVDVAVTTVGALALAVTLFYGLRGFFDDDLSPALIGVMTAFVALWGASAVYPFYRVMSPGEPLFQTSLTRSGPAVTVPLRGKPGRYRFIVEDHFLAATEGRTNRTAAYKIALGHEGTTDRLLEGTFSQEWGSQRVGAGRRSSLVPVMHETTQHLDLIEDPEGRDLTVQLTELSAGVGDHVRLRVYTESISTPILVALGVLAIAVAVLLDGWRPKGVSEGLLSTLSLATLLSVVVFRNSSVATPGFPQLIVASLVGTLAGGVGASLLWRLTQPLRKYLPPRP